MQQIHQEHGPFSAELQLIVSGTHLLPHYGETVRFIEADQIPIAARVPCTLSADTPLDTSRAASEMLAGFASALHDLRPDLAVILGDRYEMLAAATACVLAQVPIAHIHGGEITTGAIDDSIRHAITKLSYWHFASTDRYAKRIAQMGETPSRIFMCGAPGIDQIASAPVITDQELSQALGIALTPPVLLITYHPETLSADSPLTQVKALAAALSHFPEATCIITGANADSGGQEINAFWEQSAIKHKHWLFQHSLGHERYVQTMRLSQLMIGNTSSGVIEGPTLGKAVVNIGHRQDGRLRLPGVIDCPAETIAIIAAIRQALSPNFQSQLRPQHSFGIPGQVCRQIAQKLLSVTIPQAPVKDFIDL